MSPLAKTRTSQAILQPVLAAEDFRLFKEMMVQKNIEMQLQAIRIIQERNGVLPDCLTDRSDAYTEIEEEEMKILREVLRKSKEEYDLEQERKRTKESHDKLSSSDGAHKSPGHLSKSAGPKAAPDLTTKLSSVLNTSEMKEGKWVVLGLRIAAVPAIETRHLNSHFNTSFSQRENCFTNTDTKHRDLPAQELSARTKEDSGKKAIGNGSECIAKQAAVEGRKLSELGAQELREREDYLKQKRDALMALKKESKNNTPTQSAEQKEEPLAAREAKDDGMKVLLACIISV
ncbi:hypothetical protein JD844_025654 [Phrynosoma platyrhinos]|uniref:Cilia- and flagella-associated protein 36 n=1 Tax=Phrynosoma platyrhinos TaxID=52577 RepID=A0ABQ7T0P4_PHRPL|nr:hypothetical protein JD844_025654 [Phrynosoma platyrhinos]